MACPGHVREAERQANAATKTSFSCPSEAALAAGASSSRARGSSKLCLCSLRGFSPELHSTSTASRVPSVGTSGAESLRRHQQGLIVRALSETRRERGSFSCSIASQMAPISSASNSGAAGANQFIGETSCSAIIMVGATGDKRLRGGLPTDGSPLPRSALGHRRAWAVLVHRADIVNATFCR